MGTNIFYPITLTLEFGLLNLVDNFLTVSARALVFHMSISCDKIFLLVSSYLSLWPWPSLELAIIWGIFVSQAHLVYSLFFLKLISKSCPTSSYFYLKNLLFSFKVKMSDATVSHIFFNTVHINTCTWKSLYLHLIFFIFHKVVHTLIKIRKTPFNWTKNNLAAQ